VTRLHALAIIALFWAAIFLPGLGSVELKGEEGRRIMPAVTMLETGNWIVPYVGGKPYLRKPPMLNWLIACSIKILGAKNELAARLPSALSMLALGVAIVWVVGGWLGVEAALVAAIFALTNVGMLEKARLAEIEALYVALTGIGLVCWLAWRQDERSPWLVWVAPFFFFGLAMLTKGPPCLLFFYAVAAVVLWRERRLREFASIHHALGFLLMLAMFCAWAVPYLRMQPDALRVWTKESAGRFGEDTFEWHAWLLAVPRGLGNFAPWVALLPLFWREDCLARVGGRDAALVRALRWPVLILFFGLLLIPGVLPRYTLPMLAPASVLLALVLHDDAETVRKIVVPIWKKICIVLIVVLVLGAAAAMRDARAVRLPALSVIAIAALLFTKRRQLARPLNLALCSGVIAACGVALYALAVVPRVQAAANVKPVGDFINKIVPAGSEVYVFNVRFLTGKEFAAYHPALYYVRAKCVYVSDADALPARADFAFTRDEALERLRARGREPSVLGEFSDKLGRRFVVVRLDDSRKPD
jgi:4-amino-4-deoxy-L-arabinose transferase-like glycosyltransferase